MTQSPQTLALSIPLSGRPRLSADVTAVLGVIRARHACHSATQSCSDKAQRLLVLGGQDKFRGGRSGTSGDLFAAGFQEAEGGPACLLAVSPLQPYHPSVAGCTQRPLRDGRPGAPCLGFSQWGAGGDFPVIWMVLFQGCSAGRVFDPGQALLPVFLIGL